MCSLPSLESYPCASSEVSQKPLNQPHLAWPTVDHFVTESWVVANNIVLIPHIRLLTLVTPDINFANDVLFMPIYTPNVGYVGYVSCFDAAIS